jgi:hypothetical protein
VAVSEVHRNASSEKIIRLLSNTHARARERRSWRRQECLQRIFLNSCPHRARARDCAKFFPVKDIGIEFEVHRTYYGSVARFC